MPTDDSVRLDYGKVVPPFREQAGDESPKSPVRGLQTRSFGVPLENFELVAESNVLQGKLSAGLETGDDCAGDDF